MTLDIHAIRSRVFKIMDYLGREVAWKKGAEPGDELGAHLKRCAGELNELAALVNGEANEPDWYTTVRERGKLTGPIEDIWRTEFGQLVHVGRAEAERLYPDEPIRHSPMEFENTPVFFPAEVEHDEHPQVEI